MAVLVAVIAVFAVGACSGEPDNAIVQDEPSSEPLSLEGRARVSGTAARLTADEAVGDVIPTPFLITIPNRGEGGLEIPHVLVTGQAASVVWQGGQPLPVTGRGPGLEVGPARVALDANGIRWSLDGAPRRLLPGPYLLGSTVAVGTSGLPTPVERIVVTADEDTVFTTRGDASVAYQPRESRLEGRSGPLTIEGDLVIETSRGLTKASNLQLSEGTWVVELTPSAGGYRITATLEGSIETG